MTITIAIILIALVIISLLITFCYKLTKGVFDVLIGICAFILIISLILHFV